MDRPIAFITGGSQGIGAGIAVEMAKAGYDIAISYNKNKEKAMDVKAQLEDLGAKAAVIQGDISVLKDIDRMFDEYFNIYDHIDVMVNNAGITRYKPFLELTPEIFEEVINTNLRGSCFCAQKAARNMVEKKVKGVIINITSNQQTGNWPLACIYGPSKAALNKLTSHTAMELAPYGIRVVSIAPGYTKVREATPERQHWVEEMSNRIPLNRYCEPWEVGKACVFLAGEGSGYITGTCLLMDGGSLLPVVTENNYS